MSKKETDWWHGEIEWEYDRNNDRVGPVTPDKKPLTGVIINGTTRYAPPKQVDCCLHGFKGACPLC